MLTQTPIGYTGQPILEAVRRSLVERCGNRCEGCGKKNDVGTGADLKGGTRLFATLYGEPTKDLSHWRVYCWECRARNQVLPAGDGDQLEIPFEQPSPDHWTEVTW